MEKKRYQAQAIRVLNTLSKTHPNISLGKHIATALDGSDLFNILDRDLLKALMDYTIELDLDVTHSEDVTQIIKEGMNLGTILEDQEEI